jgi:sulfatase modifying factor 1
VSGDRVQSRRHPSTQPSTLKTAARDALTPDTGCRDTSASLIGLAGGASRWGHRLARDTPLTGRDRRTAWPLSPFSISPVAVTNADFDRFTDATGYRTGAEADG